MTYNFDPDQWFERQKLAIEDRHRRGELDDSGLRTAMAELEKRYDEMVERLDGTYTIPGE